MTRLARCIIAAAFTAAFATGMGFLVKATRTGIFEVACSDTDITITNRNSFITPEFVREFVEGAYGTVVGMRLTDIDLDAIERKISSKSYVAGCEAWTTCNGILHISVSQKEPAFKFIDNGNGFYCDRNESVFPLQPGYDPETVIFTGAIRNALDSAYRHTLVVFADKVSKYDIPELEKGNYSILKNGDVVINTSDASIIFGEPDRFDGKDKLLSEWYSSVRTTREPNYYKTVNIKYKGQIICRTDMLQP